MCLIQLQVAHQNLHVTKRYPNLAKGCCTSYNAPDWEDSPGSQPPQPFNHNWDHKGSHA